MNARAWRFALSIASVFAIFGAWMLLGREDGGASATTLASPPPGGTGGGDALPALAVGHDGGAPQRLSEADLRELMRRYGLETELDKRGALLAILLANPSEEVKAFALDLAASRDPVARGEGLELLKAFPLVDPEVRGFLVDQIDREQAPEMLTKLLDMLSPTMIATEDAAPLVSSLARLREHPDADVRAASVLQSSQWDRGDGLEGILRDAMLDPDARVRQAAISGITAERIRSDRLKEMLLAIAYDPQTSREERNRALFALEGFALNRTEYEIYRQAARLDGAGHGHHH